MADRWRALVKSWGRPLLDLPSGALLFWIVCAYSACRLYGYYHVDEIGQITAFDALKLDFQPVADMPWEFAARMRPWLQPAFYYLFVAPLVSLVGYSYPLIERVTVLAQLALMTLVLPGFVRSVMSVAPQVGSRPLARYGLVSVAGLWFLPSMLMRHSSEAMATLLLALSLSLWHRLEDAAPELKARLAFFAGLCAGLAFWCRFQVALFVAGFWVARAFASDRRQRALWQALLLFAAGVIVTMPLGVAADFWGYGELSFSPWSYFLQNIVNDRAAEFGRSPWYWYLFEVALVTLNPLVWLWLGRAAVVTFDKPFFRALSVGLGLFLLTHFAVSHKEIRFLLPAVAPAILLVAAMLGTEASKTDRWLGTLSYVRVVATLNVVALVGMSLFGLVRDRARVERALWELPHGSVVLSAANLFGHFDEEVSPAPVEGGMLMRTFLKPPSLRFVYVAEAELVSACHDRPEALALLTRDHEPQETRALDPTRMPTVAEYPPAWFKVDAAWFRRMWRFRLVRCADLTAAVSAAGP